MKNHIVVKEVKLVDSTSARKNKKYKCIIVGPKEFDSSYTFCEDTIIKYMIFKDKEYFVEEFKEILISETKFNALNYALNFISYQFRSKSEVINHLAKKEITTQIIDDTIAKLTELGYIDDLKYANYIVESYQRKLKGPEYCIKMLMSKNVSSHIINKAIDNYPTEVEVELINQVVLKELPKLTKYPILKQKMKLKSKLSSSGFRLESINAVLKSISYEEDVEESLAKEIQKLMRKHQELDQRKKEQKIISSLISKGYNYSQIKKALSEIDE